MHSKAWLSRLLALITIIIWSTVYIPTRQLQHLYTPTQIGVLRYGVATIVMLIVALIRKERLPRGRDWPLFFAGGICGFGLYIILFNSAATMLPSGVCAFVVTMSSIFTVVLAVPVLHERIRPGEAISLFIQLAGVGILTLSGSTLTLNKGVIIMVIAAMLLGSYNLIQRLLVKRGYNALQITIWCIVCGTIFLLAAAAGSLGTMPLPGPVDIGSSLYLGVVASAFAYYLWAAALRLADKAGSVSNFMFLIPFTTSLLGFLVLKETMGWEVCLGGGVITVGFLIYIYSGRK